MRARLFLIVCAVLVNSSCSIEFPLSDHRVDLIGRHSAAEDRSNDERALGNPSAVP